MNVRHAFSVNDVAKLLGDYRRLEQAETPMVRRAWYDMFALWSVDFKFESPGTEGLDPVEAALTAAGYSQDWHAYFGNPGLYAFWDKEDSSKILWIGKAKRLGKRIPQHQSSNPLLWHLKGEITALAIKGVNKWLLKRWEDQALAEINPPGNKQGTTPLLHHFKSV